jgi:Fur family iron response transcriptional regulator
MIRAQQDRVTAWLAKGNLRPTRQRLALATLLVGDGENRHVTAESLYALCAASGEKVSLATVYNTLRAFCAAELINEIVVDGARIYFDTRMDDHAHFYLEDSHDLTDVPTGGIQITGLPDAPAGMVITRFDVVIRLRRS